MIWILLECLGCMALSVTYGVACALAVMKLAEMYNDRYYPEQPNKVLAVHYAETWDGGDL